MLKSLTLQITPFAQNCRVLWCSETMQAAMVDPGGEVDLLLEAVSSRGLRLEQLWLTHAHLDHCGGAAGIKRCLKCILCGHLAEKEMRSRVRQMCEMFEIPPGIMENCPEPDRYVDQGDLLELGALRFEVLYTPGHSPGHVCYYCREEGVLLSGDLLFAGSVGRTDLPGGSATLLQRSLKEKLMILPDTTKVWPGHGPDTTIGVERVSNPFLRGDNYGWF